MAEESASFQKLIFPYFPYFTSPEALREKTDQCRSIGSLSHSASSPYHTCQNKKCVIFMLQHNWKEIKLQIRLGELLIERKINKCATFGCWRLEKMKITLAGLGGKTPSRLGQDRQTEEGL